MDLLTPEAVDQGAATRRMVAAIKAGLENTTGLGPASIGRATLGVLAQLERIGAYDAGAAFTINPGD